MSSPREPFLGWPGWRILGFAVAVGTVQTLWWVLVFHGAAALTADRERTRLHFDAELNIPFVPATILVYQSLNAAFVFAPFVLRTRAELEALAFTLAAVTLVAGIGYLLISAEPAYAPVLLGTWAPLYAVNERIALRTNLLPSLHVAMSTVTLGAYAMRCRFLGKTLLLGWAAAIAVSTLLTHQHHIVDVISGLLLAWWGWRYLYVPWRSRGSAGQTPPPSLPSDRGPPA